MKRTLAAILIAVAALAGCGAKKSTSTPPATTQLRLVLDYLPNPDHAGIYAAIAQGDFTREGLSVTPQVPSDPTVPLKLVESGRADLGISYEPDLLLARDKGASDLIAVGALVRTPLTSIMAIGKAHVKKPVDLDHKTVGTAGIPYQASYLSTILDGAGVDPAHVKSVNVGFNLVPAMVSGKVDATLGAFWNVEGIQLARRHEHPAIIPVDQAGVPTYDELIFVARKSFLEHHGELVRRFMQGLQLGTKALARDVSGGIAPLLAADKGADRGFVAESVAKTLPYLQPAQASQPFGYMDPKAWQTFGAWMQSHQLVSNPVSPAALDSEFLPGQGI